MANELWAALVGVGGAILGTWYGARLSRAAARDLLAQQAKSEFATAFTDTLFKLGLPAMAVGRGEAWQILRDDYPKHLIAYIRLRSILSRRDQIVIDEAWGKYVMDDKNDLPEEREMYRFKHVLGLGSNEQQFKLAAKLINTLLASAAA